MVRRAPTTAHDLLAEGQDALRAGDKLRAQRLFRSVLRTDPVNEEALLWLSGAVEPSEAFRYLQQVLQINPANEQAQEGLAWITQTYGVVDLEPSVAPGPTKTEPVAQLPAIKPMVGAPTSSGDPDLSTLSPTPITPTPPPTVYKPSRARTYPAVPTAPLRELVATAGEVASIGALLGFLRLVVALRPTALIAGRGEAIALSWIAAGGIALFAALAHSLVLLLAWWLLADRLARLRNDRQGDRFQSLLDAGRTFLPGYLAAIALGLALLGVGWSEQRWLPVVVAIFVLLGLALAAMVRSVLQLRVPLRIRTVAPHQTLLSLFGPPLLAAMVGLWLAGMLVVLVLGWM